MTARWTMETDMIDGKTRLIGIIGNPLGHTLSPYIHNYLLEKFDLPFVYVPLCVAHESLPMLVHSLRAVNFAGANVTIPFKRAVIPYCDTISELSRLTGTVNTLVMRHDLLHGTTTDAEGFFQALLHTGYNTSGGEIVICGNGGTAQTLAIAMALEKKIKTLTLIGRNASRLRTLVAEINIKTGFSPEFALIDTAESLKALQQCNLLVNCTPVGMSPNIDESALPPEVFHRGMTVFDTIYNPLQTRLLDYAAQAGCKTQNGLRMLVYQGLASFKLWTGIEATIDLFDLENLRTMVQ